MPYDRKFFFDSVRASLFGGNLTQSQVDGMNYVLGIWERHFEAGNPRDGTNWLAYALATFYHETAKTMKPIEEYGKGSGKSYGNATGPYNQKYYGRGHVQLTWEDNYKKGQKYLKERYNVDADIHPNASKMLTDETSALISFDGMVNGWFTGVGLPKYFNGTTEDSVNARKIINGLDKADTISGYYKKFKTALKKIPATAVPPVTIEAELPDLPTEAPMPEPVENPTEEHAEAHARRLGANVTRTGGSTKV
jgi:putative chitinase